MIIAAAQCCSVPGDIHKNTSTHLDFVKKASGFKTDFILFPELSLTGYEPTMAQQLAITEKDKALAPFVQAAQSHNMTIGIGAPYQSIDGVQIATFFIAPSGNISLYGKHFLHDGEERFFQPSNSNCTLEYESHKIGHAICADIAHQEHPVMVANHGCNIYASSVLITPNGYTADANILQSYAQKHNMLVLMANHGGPSGGFASAGMSAIWGQCGKLLATLPGIGDGMVLAKHENNMWTGETYMF